MKLAFLIAAIVVFILATLSVAVGVPLVPLGLTFLAASFLPIP